MEKWKAAGIVITGAMRYVIKELEKQFINVQLTAQTWDVMQDAADRRLREYADVRSDLDKFDFGKLGVRIGAAETDQGDLLVTVPEISDPVLKEHWRQYVEWLRDNPHMAGRNIYKGTPPENKR